MKLSAHLMDLIKAAGLDEAEPCDPRRIALLLGYGAGYSCGHQEGFKEGEESVRSRIKEALSPSPWPD